jgi:hypothetical protein
MRTTNRQPKPKKKRNRLITFLAFLGFLVLVFSCLLSGIGNDKTLEQAAPQQPTAIQKLIVQAGSLSQYESQIAKDTAVNVYKKDGTLDQREDDLKELCLDWLYYRAKIVEYVSSGDSEKADKARASFNQVNNWLSDYVEDDVQTMFSIIDENKWSQW